jgi:hypothetical protein
MALHVIHDVQTTSETSNSRLRARGEGVGQATFAAVLAVLVEGHLQDG